MLVVRVCVSYCGRYNWTHGRPVLVRPYDAMFMSYESQPASDDAVFDWLTHCLSQHIHVIHSVAELERELSRHTEPATVISCLSQSAKPPLFLAVLSVVLASQVRFVRVARSIATQALTLPDDDQMTLIISTAELQYVYGSGQADCMTLSAVRLLLTMLAPSTADLLDLVITLSLLAVCLQPCVVFTRPLASLMSSSLQLCLVLFLYCVFVPQHELHVLLLDPVLPIWRYIMLSSFGDVVRCDWLRYSTVDFTGFVLSYFLYLLMVLYICRRLYSTTMVHDEHIQYVDWYVWQQFGVPDFWLTASSSVDCTQCHQPLSDGHSVCRSACQHVFHHSCLANLTYTHQLCVCPQCNSAIYNTPLNCDAQ